VFAVQGGEFGTVDLWRQRRETTHLIEAIDSLKHLDSALTVYERNVEHDPATQERIAREVFGMVRGNKELLYRFTGPAAKATTDTARRIH
jgi:cell division protein FtsB